MGVYNQWFFGSTNGTSLTPPKPDSLETLRAENQQLKRDIEGWKYLLDMERRKVAQLEQELALEREGDGF